MLSWHRVVVCMGLWSVAFVSDYIELSFASTLPVPNGPGSRSKAPHKDVPKTLLSVTLVSAMSDETSSAHGPINVYPLTVRINFYSAA
jgi:hypothetical protein